MKMKNNSKPIVVGKIYAEWCGYCIALQPEWEKMKTQLGGKTVIFKEIKSNDIDSGIKDINETYLNKSDKKLELEGGYPTIFKIKNGKLEYYNGNRTSHDLANWVLGKIQNGGKSKKSRKTIKSKKSKKSRKSRKTMKSKK